MGPSSGPEQWARAESAVLLSRARSALPPAVAPTRRSRSATKPPSTRNWSESRVPQVRIKPTAPRSGGRRSRGATKPRSTSHSSESRDPQVRITRMALQPGMLEAAWLRS